MNEQLADAEKLFTQALNHFEEAAKKIRTGRAHPSMLDGVMVEAYGSAMPLNQAANVNAVEAQLLVITPFDPGNLQAIAEAIRNDQSLGLNPSDDGRVVRVPIPALNTERRQEIVRQLHEKMEESMISLRNARHEVLTDAKEDLNAKKITQDDYTRFDKQVGEALEKVKLQIEALAKNKEQEILAV